MSDKPMWTLQVTGTISSTVAPGPIGRRIRVIQCGTGGSAPVGTISTSFDNVASPVYEGCICLLNPWAARADGCPDHGLQPLTTHRVTLMDTLRMAVKRGDLHKILPRMTADEVAVAERGLPESMRATVRAAWRTLR